ncbi:unnamed protein product [Notodromas monacha]|uniref:tRNA-intron lyase n=1 Tax=Notodromas monacha TaxID=399045 RepID=A0A7R9BS02_9CRUS|nr:unnamed protein product [Notodromas monacha]CAG0919108.1 unnamed protein product [Notodromas monacha]
MEIRAFRKRNTSDHPKNLFPGADGKNVCVRAVLRRNEVVVTRASDVKILNTQGCFGKLIEFVAESETEQMLHKRRKLWSDPSCKFSCTSRLSSLSESNEFSPAVTTVDTETFAETDAEMFEGQLGNVDSIGDSLPTELLTKDNFAGRFQCENSQSVVSSCSPSHMLFLCAEEVFFLTSELGCLEVEHDGIILSLEELWSALNSSDVSFLARYAAYLHLRQKRWVVKPGLRFGVDWLLYKDGPNFFHASLAVKVVYDHCSSREKGDLTLSQLRRLARICISVSKQLLVLTVIIPDTVEIPTKAIDVRLVTVVTSLVQRWNEL